MPGIKKLAQTLFLLTSAFVLSTTFGYNAEIVGQSGGILPPPRRQQLTPEQSLIQAVKNGDLSMVKRSINTDGIDKNTRDLVDKNSLLHLAI